MKLWTSQNKFTGKPLVFVAVTGIDIWLAVFSITLIAVLYTLLVSWYSAHLICKHKRYYHRAVKRPAALYMVDPFLTNYHSFTISSRCNHFHVDSVKYVPTNNNPTGFSLNSIDRVINFHKIFWYFQLLLDLMYFEIKIIQIRWANTFLSTTDVWPP